MNILVFVLGVGFIYKLYLIHTFQFPRLQYLDLLMQNDKEIFNEEEDAKVNKKKLAAYIKSRNKVLRDINFSKLFIFCFSLVILYFSLIFDFKYD